MSNKLNHAHHHHHMPTAPRTGASAVMAATLRRASASGISGSSAPPDAGPRTMANTSASSSPSLNTSFVMLVAALRALRREA